MAGVRVFGTVGDILLHVGCENVSYGCGNKVPTFDAGGEEVTEEESKRQVGLVVNDTTSPRSVSKC